MATKKNAKTASKKGHLCLLASEGEFEKIKTLTAKPKFICFNCGRVANSDRNLCNPMQLES